MQNWCTEGEPVLNFARSKAIQPNKVYDEVIEFIASSRPQNMIVFRPSGKRWKDYRKTRHPNSISTLRLSTLLRMAKVRAYNCLAEA
jgi:hypothetical protein